MTFLNPAVLFGLLAASIPVIIHLLNLRKLKKIEFSTLTFLKELQKNKIRKVKIKQWLLLALRIIIILLLVFAFARPTLKGIAIGGTTSAAKTTAVFIIDDTFSMSVVDSKGSYLNQAKETAKKLLDQMQEGDEAALVQVSHLDNYEEIKATVNLNEIAKQINALEINHSSSSIHNAVLKASRITGESKNFNKEIYLLSDFQKTKIAPANSTSDLSSLLDDNVKLYTFNFSGKSVFNVSIDKLELNTKIFEKGKPVSFIASVTNQSDEPVNNAVVSLFLNKERSAQQSINMAAGESKQIILEAVNKSSGYIEASAEIEDDAILQDNRRFVNFFVPSEIPVLILSDKAEDVKYIRLALSFAETEGTLKITEKNSNQLTSTNLTQYSAVVLTGTEHQLNFTNLNSFVTNGGGLLIFPGSNTSIASFQNMLSALSIPPPQSTGGSKDNADNPILIDQIEFEHPLFTDIFTKDAKRKIESPEFYYHFKQSAGNKGQSIISLQDGSSFLSEYIQQRGNVILFNTSPVLSWSNFPLKSIFVPLINKMIFYLASTQTNGKEYLAGEDLDINISGNTGVQLKIERPDNTPDYLNPDSQEKNYAVYDKANKSGTYKVFTGSKVIDMIAVNVDPLESVTRYAEESDFEKYLSQISFKGKHIVINTNEDPANLVLQARFGSELWRYFLLAALLTALIEMAVARNAKKDLTEIQTK